MRRYVYYVVILVISCPVDGIGAPRTSIVLRANLIDETIQRQTEDVISLTTEFLSSQFPQIGDDDNLPTEVTLSLYKTPDAFRNAISEKTRGRFDHQLAATDYKNKVAHVAIQPELSDAALDKIGLPLLTRYQIAHEVTHLWLAAEYPIYLDREDWIREGLATWAAGEVMLRGKWIRSFESDPYASTRLRRVQRLFLGRNRFFTPMNEKWYRALSHGDQYAAAWQWCRYLIDEAKIVRPIELITQPPIARTYNDATISTSFARFAEQQSYSWNEIGRSLDTSRDSWIQSAFVESDAITWRENTPFRRGKPLTGTCTLLANSGHHAAVVLMLASDGHLEVSFDARDGVNVNWISDGTSKRNLASSQEFQLKMAEPFEFEISYDRSHLWVKVNGEYVIRAELDDKRPGEKWGVVAGKGSAVIWKNVRIGGKGD